MTKGADIPGCEDVAIVSGNEPPLDDDTVARTAHALAHPARIAIVRYLAAQEGCVAGEIFEQLDLAQSTVSQHLRVLKEAGLIHATIHGNRTYYCIVPSALVRFEHVIEGLVGGYSSKELQANRERG